MQNYSYKKTVSYSFQEAVTKIKEVLKTEGFGIVSEIDIQQKVKQMLQIDYDQYLILGVCKPELAHRALEIEKEIGLLLPCNVIIYEDNGSVVVSALLPSVSMGFVKEVELKYIVEEVEPKLKKCIDSLN
ncbi:DUF302 domain-containing protein [Candidatus Peregrinibacteria bacterium]|jgi:uncharacterized protein (DUF302 family)|nr:DUF302 domain-containing protein [Candidatus Peregrinibacteria bacterium]